VIDTSGLFHASDHTFQMPRSKQDKMSRDRDTTIVWEHGRAITKITSIKLSRGWITKPTVEEYSESNVSAGENTVANQAVKWHDKVTSGSESLKKYRKF
jgi:hypothetical protein